nr:MAG TPA: tail completion protein [Bacteriophage sp.]
MTLEALHKILQTTGYPAAYRFFAKRQEPPFLCYQVAYTRNLGADDAVWQKINHIQIELYTRKKDLAAEQKLENALTEAGLFFNAEETYIDTEKIYQRIYEIEV